MTRPVGLLGGIFMVSCLKVRLILPLIVCLSLVSCGPFADPFSAEAYAQATSLKARSLDLIKRGGKPYAKNQARAEDLLLDIAKAYEFARGRGREAAATAAKQYLAILDPEGGSIAAYVAVWETQGTVGAFSRGQFEEVVRLQFDRIIELEAGRKAISDEDKNG